MFHLYLHFVCDILIISPFGVIAQFAMKSTYRGISDHTSTWITTTHGRDLEFLLLVSAPWLLQKTSAEGTNGG